MKILAIDTSCDDTSVAISEGDKILSNIISSQIELHKKWGGVVPILAKRNHEERIDAVISEALKRAKIQIEQVDIIAVTYGPGLSPALEVGVSKAKELAVKYSKKLIAVNHMVGHIYANFAKNSKGTAYNQGLFESSPFPVLALLISGGHTEIILMEEHMKFEKVGKTLDDSVGEAFDKVSNMLNWGYPGGPVVEKFAEQGDPEKFDLPIPMKNSGDLNFSYSGLKTAVLRVAKEIGVAGPSKFEQNQKIETKSEELKEGDYKPSFSKKPIYKLEKQDALDLAASFQKVAAEQLVIKMKAAVKKYQPRAVLMGGGVVNNILIKTRLRSELKKLGTNLYHPQNKRLLTDNAGMIAIAAYYMSLREEYSDPELLDRKPRLSL